MELDVPGRVRLIPGVPFSAWKTLLSSLQMPKGQRTSTTLPFFYGARHFQTQGHAAPTGSGHTLRSFYARLIKAPNRT